MELTKSASLRLLVTVAGCEIAYLLRQRLIEKAVLKESTHSACSTLGTKCDRASALIVEGVHFLLYNVGCVTYTAAEKLGVLKHGCTDFFITEFGCYIEHSLLYVAVFIAVCRQEILRAFDSFGH
jgi:hypothetical protein